ncbi:MAG: elongation factor Ts [Halothiobacillaceae bacterium]|nr:MAG: elongation factor Ts [Halothiobacillaceae bacterium]
MTAITAAMVKELRERTAAGMMECKRALVEVGGDIDAAIELMRKQGTAKADKKAGRTAADGVVVMSVSADGKTAVMVEINSETDFVAKSDDFVKFANEVADVALKANPADVDALLACAMASGDDVNTARSNLVAKIGENLQVRRFARIETTGVVGAYRHGERIGVLVDLVGGGVELAKDIAMHVAASRPVCVSEADVPAELVEKEREIFTEQASQSGKPAEIVARMVDGRVKKYLAEVALTGQPFVKDPDQTVAALLKKAGAEVKSFVRFEVGEGIEKQQTDFAAEVMAQVQGA